MLKKLIRFDFSYKTHQILAIVGFFVILDAGFRLVKSIIFDMFFGLQVSFLIMMILVAMFFILNLIKCRNIIQNNHDGE